MAIAEYLHERHPHRGLFPADLAERAWCRSICGEMSTGFANLRVALPMNLRPDPGHRAITGSGAHNDIDRILSIWTDCLNHSGGPYLFGSHPTVADAMYAPVCTRFKTYNIALPPALNRYGDAIHALAPMHQWLTSAAQSRR